MTSSIENLSPSEIAELLTALTKVLEANKAVGTFVLVQTQTISVINSILKSIK